MDEWWGSSSVIVPGTANGRRFRSPSLRWRASSRVLSGLPGLTQFWQWASDSQSVFVQKNVGDGIELWRLPLSGPPRKLDVDGRQWTEFAISPDEKRIAFAARAGKPGNEVWALENFLPAPAAGQ
jgi:hypothetical protein